MSSSSPLIGSNNNNNTNNMSTTAAVGGNGNGSSSGGGTAAPVAPVNTADPTILTYLYAASKAFPRVEQILDQQQQEMLVETLDAMHRGEALDTQLETQVRRYRSERERVATEEEATIQRTLFLEKQIISEDDRFEAEMIDIAQKHKEKCDEIQIEIDRLKVRSDRAKAWEAIRTGKKEELATLTAKVAALKAQHKGEIKVMLSNHEEERRKLRDVLVKKLRTMRDHMTVDDDANLNLVLADDDNSTASPSATNTNEKGGGGTTTTSSSGAVKLTERLSREVTTYERESKATTAAISAHEAQRDALLSQLRASRESNERLVFKNAANAQSYKMLQKKLDELNGVSASTVPASSTTAGLSGGSTYNVANSPRNSPRGGTPRRNNNNNTTSATNLLASTSGRNMRGATTTIGGTLVTTTNSSSTATKNTNSNSNAVTASLQLALSAERQLRIDAEKELLMAQDELSAVMAERREAEHQLLAQVEKDLNALEFIESLETLLGGDDGEYDDDNNGDGRRRTSSLSTTPGTALRSVMDSRHAALSRKEGRLGGGGDDETDGGGQSPPTPSSATVTNSIVKKPSTTPTTTILPAINANNNKNTNKTNSKTTTMGNGSVGGEEGSTNKAGSSSGAGSGWAPEPVYAIGLYSQEEILKFLSVAMNCLLASVPKDIVVNGGGSL